MKFEKIKFEKYENQILFAVAAMLLWMVSSWLTHIIVCIQNSEWGFMIAGAILVPIAWIHGTGIWFGFW